MSDSESTKPQVLFAGSFLAYSARILEQLLASPLLEVVGVLTTPPQPGGRSKELVPTPVHQMAIAHDLPVCTPATLDDSSLAEIETAIGRPQILLTAGYGKLVPPSWLSFPTVAALNLHFSLLPAYRGANPAEWALLRAETETGVTLIEMSPTFDTGKMVAQSPAVITPDETRETLYAKLYELGGQVLPEMVLEYLRFRQGSVTSDGRSKHITYFLPPVEQPSSPTPYAQRLTRDDGFVSWTAVQAAMTGAPSDAADLSLQLAAILATTEFKQDTVFLERAIRALVGFPGIWSTVETAKGPRRLKLIAAHLENGRLVLDRVQLEGQAPAAWNEIKTALV